jgi:hypothetical protein
MAFCILLIYLAIFIIIFLDTGSVPVINIVASHTSTYSNYIQRDLPLTINQL